jgi:WD40 repeat protein
VNNHLAVALGSNVYLWNASSGDITQLLQLDNPEEYIGAVSWVTEGNILAVGTSGGEVQVTKTVFLTWGKENLIIINKTIYTHKKFCIE